MNLDKIILEGHGKMISDERDLAFLTKIEEKMNTGPIIGDARETLLSLSRNLLIRDLLLDSLNIDVEKREKIFHWLNKMLRESDEKILKERDENKRRD